MGPTRLGVGPRGLRPVGDEEVGDRFTRRSNSSVDRRALDRPAFDRRKKMDGASAMSSARAVCARGISP